MKIGRNKIFELKIDTYDIPYVKFDIGNGHNGRYFFDKGFDEQSTLKNPNYYDTIHVKGNVYYIPVLGVSVRNEAVIKVDLKDFESKITNDTTFRIIFKSRMNNIIQLNGQNDSLVVNRTELENIKNNGLRIYSQRAINGNTITPTFIDVIIKSTREVVGCLEYYSADQVEKNVTLIYTKFADESNYPSVDFNAIENYLRNNSHNQLFIKFNVDTVRYNSNLRTVAFDTCTTSTSAFIMLRTNAAPRFNFATNFGGHLTIPTDYYFITNLSINGSDVKGAHYTNNAGGGIRFKNGTSVSDGEITAHELGHWLGFPESFKGNGVIINFPINTTQGATRHNFMDYGVTRRRWYKIQLINQQHR
ncbi:hypothetical protein [Dysgonomonas sp. 520]|uniref:hypothetical protein n=1 Tax=Dysgonomonas sp. 520 TaxID=2302931 RepID=UPI0013D6E74A|nr:hypothetical protein [Dysgonomonas sp. 520]NDW11238.1 hypothetical protein [Dysgonomonas sp. 520]